MAAWTRKCSPASVGLKNEYECRLLPKTCQKEASLQKLLAERACSLENFSRKLRQKSNAQSSFILSVTSLALSALIAILL